MNLRKLLFPPIKRGESPGIGGIYSSVIPGGMTQKEWEDGGWHKYRWGNVEKTIELIDNKYRNANKRTDKSAGV